MILSTWKINDFFNVFLIICSHKTSFVHLDAEDLSTAAYIARLWEKKRKKKEWINKSNIISCFIQPRERPGRISKIPSFFPFTFSFFFFFFLRAVFYSFILLFHFKSDFTDICGNIICRTFSLSLYIYIYICLYAWQTTCLYLGSAFASLFLVTGCSQNIQTYPLMLVIFSVAKIVRLSKGKKGVLFPSSFLLS